MLCWITRIDPSLPICSDISETPKFHMAYNFYSGILLGDTHNKHILIILLIDWWNFRKLQEWFSEFEWDEDSGFTSWLGLQNFLMEFYQVYEKSHPQLGTRFFYYLKMPNIFVERMYQLKNFDMMSNIVILAVYLSSSTHTT